VREAFGLSLCNAKMLVDTACSGELDAMLAEAVAAKGG
jgi:ribosomal protein L7/L12